MKIKNLTERNEKMRGSNNLIENTLKKVPCNKKLSADRTADRDEKIR